MNLINIYHFYRGFVVIEIVGYQLERFLNMATNQNIFFWDIKRKSVDKMELKISRRGFKKIRRIAHMTKTKIHIKDKKGSYNVVKKVKNRKILVGGLLGIFLLTMFITSFVLEIEIVGNETVETDLILEKLREINLKKWSFRSKIKSDDINLKLMNDIDNIAWVGINEKGTKLVIEIKERRLPPKIVPKDVPCHVVATRDAIIKKMTVTNGQPTVDLESVVTEGQVLVSGIIETKHDGQRYVHSMAEILGKTWYEDFLEVKTYEYEKTYTGNKKTKYFISAFNKTFDLTFLRKIEYYNCDEETQKQIFGFLKFEKITYKDYELHRKDISRETAIANGEKELLEKLNGFYETNNIKTKSFEHTDVDGETIKIRLIAECLEEVGEELAISTGG